MFISICVMREAERLEAAEYICMNCDLKVKFVLLSVLFLTVVFYK